MNRRQDPVRPRNRLGARGVTLIEVLIATFLFTLFAASLAGTLTSAEHARRTSGKWLTATQLAAERLERLRAGDRETDEPPVEGFERTWHAAGEPGIAGVERVAVRVTWHDRGERSFTLVSFLRVNE
jgi:Tfp pilus assembly protein PilV